jgi:hypothetical protein
MSEPLLEIVSDGEALGRDRAAVSKFAVASTGRLHVMLRCAEQKDLSEEDRGKMMAAGRAMIRDAEKRGIPRSNILVNEGEPRKRKPQK